MERREKVANLIKKLTALFFEREADTSSLITITDCRVSPDLKKATVFISVLPEKKESAALGFAKRKRTELRQHIKKNINIKNIPFIDIVLDLGEKNRQKIDELLRQ